MTVQISGKIDMKNKQNGGDFNIFSIASKFE